jgi:hypothetical protein
MIAQQLQIQFSDYDRQRNEQIKQIIAERIRGFVEIGELLLEVRSKHYYLIDGFNNFEEYCQEFWNFSTGRAKQFIEAYKCHQNLLEGGIEQDRLPKNENQVRPIVSLPPDQQIDTWKSVTENTPAKQVTGEQVRRKTIEKRYRLEVGQTAIVDDPNHPLYGEQLEIESIRGEIIEAMTSSGRQTFISPELRALDPIELLQQEVQKLKAAIAEIVASYPAIEPEQIEGLKELI